MYWGPYRLAGVTIVAETSDNSSSLVIRVSDKSAEAPRGRVKARAKTRLDEVINKLTFRRRGPSSRRHTFLQCRVWCVYMISLCRVRMSSSSQVKLT